MLIERISDRIKNLFIKEYKPDAIIDVGAHIGEFTVGCLNTISDCEYFLFEPNEFETHDILKSIPKVNLYRHLIFDTECEVDFYTRKNNGRYCGGSSIFKELGSAYTNVTPIKIKTKRIEDIIDVSNFNKIFIKIDVQGAELNVVKSCKSFLEKVDFILLELPFFGKYNSDTPSFVEHLIEMEKLGFLPYDVPELHYINDSLMQIDVLFINKNNELNSTVQKKLLT
jgi:FkbM family methyltransferase